MKRVRNPDELAALLAANVPDCINDGTFKPADWLSDTRNVALRVGDDLGMFDHAGPGIFLGHVWFQSRGKEAQAIARQILAEMFASYGATRICGETPTVRPDAWLFARRLGFVKIGEAVRPMGRVILSVLIGNSQPVPPVVERAASAR